MAKELPYFKFYVNEWINGDITLETLEVQGTFINVCAYYWSKECSVSKDTLLKKFRNEIENINILVSSKVIKFKGDKVAISFLDEQLQSKEVQIITNRRNGALGGRPRKEETEEKPNGLIFANINETETITETKANDNPNITNIEKSKVKNNTSSILLSAKADQEQKLLKRKEAFRNTILPYVDLYGKEMCRKFFDYWTEPNKSNTKMAFEICKTWSIKSRLSRWNERSFNKKEPKGYTPQMPN